MSSRGFGLQNPRFTGTLGVGLLLAASWCVGILGRGYWTPDEPREADLAWRMSWQADKSVPLLAGEPFCEKPPLAYWIAGAAISRLGDAAWAARLPNVLYALVTAFAVGLIGRRGAGATAGAAAAAAISTLLLSYQVGIWLATDAPLLAAVAVALLGLYDGFYADRSATRLRGFTLMHAALAIGFLCKSAAADMVPVLGLLGLVVWERRWRELVRWELYVGLLVQAALILPWVGWVAAAPDGVAHLKVFFWNNLAGRFTHVDAPDSLQYATAHRNSPGKYLLELPVYLWPWTLLTAAAVRRAWLRRRGDFRELRLVRFAAATFLPTLAVLSIAATARNIYLAPALPGAAVLLGWWVADLARHADPWDLRALRATAALLLLAVVVLVAALLILDLDPAGVTPSSIVCWSLAVAGIGICTGAAIVAWRTAGRRRRVPLVSAVALLVAYCALLIGPAWSIYRRVDDWQNLEALGHAIGRDSIGHPMILFAQDETTRAFIDEYTRTQVDWIPGPPTPGATARLRAQLAAQPESWVVAQLSGRNAKTEWRFWQPPAATTGEPAPPEWAGQVNLAVVRRYSLPHGRRYALLAPATAMR
jgi:4-amino-4-deoxy-L-arabinose transferase-like glycosyltransferase